MGHLKINFYARRTTSDEDTKYDIGSLFLIRTTRGENILYMFSTSPSGDHFLSNLRTGTRLGSTFPEKVSVAEIMASSSYFIVSVLPVSGEIVNLEVDQG